MPFVIFQETSTKNPLSSKNNNMKPTAEEYEYYDKNTRHYSNYMYQENATEDNRNIKAPAQMAPNNIQKGSTPTLSSNNTKTYNNPTTANSNAINNNNNRANNNRANNNPTSNNNMKPNAYNNMASNPNNNMKPNAYNSNPITNNGKPQNNAYNKNKYHQEEEEPEEEHNYEDEDQEQEDNEQNDENENNEEDEGNDAQVGGGNNLDEYGEPGEMVQCTMGCGRKFNANAIKKHMKICKKVFQAKRKVFDSSKARTKDVVPDKLVGKTKGKTTSQQPAKNGANKEKWKKQSEGFRAMLKQEKGGATISAEEKQELKKAMEEAQGLVPCNFCGRKFNEKAAQKHIPFCENKQKLDKLKQQPGKKR